MNAVSWLDVTAVETPSLGGVVETLDVCTLGYFFICTR